MRAKKMNAKLFKNEKKAPRRNLLILHKNSKNKKKTLLGKSFKKKWVWTSNVKKGSWSKMRDH